MISRYIGKYNEFDKRCSSHDSFSYKREVQNRDFCTFRL